MKLSVIFLFVILILAQCVSASVEIDELKTQYNIGDDIEIFGTIKADDDFSGYLQVAFVCDNQKDAQLFAGKVLEKLCDDLNLLNIAYSVILSDILYLIIVILFSFRIIRIDYKNNLKVFSSIIVSIIVLFYSLNTIDLWITNFSNLQSLLLQVFIGVITYCSVFLLLKNLLSINFSRVLVFYDK